MSEPVVLLLLSISMVTRGKAVHSLSDVRASFICDWKAAIPESGTDLPMREYRPIEGNFHEEDSGGIVALATNTFAPSEMLLNGNQRGFSLCSVKTKADCGSTTLNVSPGLSTLSKCSLSQSREVSNGTCVTVSTLVARNGVQGIA